jgi:NAD(P)-dependent dehydrogenase (short-subunit alcohol dehydrogenase family)
MVAAVIERFGRIDILVNNAGIAGAAQPFLDIALEQWRQTIDINLTGMFLCAQAVGRHMVRERRGKIINVASVGSFLPLPCSADYSASKGGVMMLTRAMALELIRHNIQVNAVCPGYIATELKQDTIERVAEKAARKVPAGRIGRSEEVAGAVVFLASSASDYMVGSSVVIDGGIMLK